MCYASQADGHGRLWRERAYKSCPYLMRIGHRDMDHWSKWYMAMNPMVQNNDAHPLKTMEYAAERQSVILPQQYYYSEKLAHHTTREVFRSIRRFFYL